MAFDYLGSWDTSATGAPATLYDRSSNVSTSYGISTWVDSRLPLYGRSWVRKSLNQTDIGAPTVAAGPKQNLSAESGVMFFSKIRDLIRDNNATEVFDTESVSTYCYAGELWVGYDNQDSVAVKVKFAKQKGLLGYTSSGLLARIVTGCCLPQNQKFCIWEHSTIWKRLPKLMTLLPLISEDKML